MIEPTMQTANQAPRVNCMSISATPDCLRQRLAPEGTIPPPSLDQVANRTTAYRLDPGFIALTVRGRERYRRVRNEVIAAAEEPGDPSTRYAAVDRAYRYKQDGDGQLLIQATNIISAPIAGYDPKGVDA